MNPLYYATMALTALSLSAGDAEARRRKVEKPQKPVPALTAEEETRLLAQIYHSLYNAREREGKRAKRDYDDRLNNCDGPLMALDFCSKQRLEELGGNAAAFQRDLDQLAEDYALIVSLSSEEKGRLEPLLVRYHSGCVAKRGKGNTAYCLELGAGILQMGVELSAPPPESPVETSFG